MRCFSLRPVFCWYALLWCWARPVPTPAQATASLASLQQAGQLAPTDTIRVRLWLQLGQLYADMPLSLPVDLDSAAAYAQKAAHLSYVLHFTSGRDGSQLLAAQASFGSNRPAPIEALLRNPRLRSASKALLVVGEYYLFKPEEEPADLSLAEQYVRQAAAQPAVGPHSSILAESQVVLGLICAERERRPQALAYYRQAAPLLGRVEDLARRARLWYWLGNSYDRSSAEMPLKINCYEQALAAYHRAGNQEAAALVLKSIADVEQARGHFGRALQLLLEVVRVQQANHSLKLHYTYDLLGAIYAAKGGYEQALPYAQAALKGARAARDTADLPLFFMRIGRIKEELGQRAAAVPYYQQALAAAERSRYDKYSFLITASVRIARIKALTEPDQALLYLQRQLQQYPPRTAYLLFTACNGLGEVHLSRHDYAAAENNLQRALRLLDQIRLPLFNDKQEYYVRLYTDLSALYAARSQYTTANRYLTQAFQVVQRRPDISRLRTLELQAFKLDSIQGQLRAALAHYQRYKALSDSVFNERKSSQLLGFQVQYETKAKEQELRLQAKNIALLTQRSRVQQISLGLQRSERNALLGGTALLLALLGLGYNRYGLGQRSNRQLLAQQQALQARQEEINRQNGMLEALVREKEWLLQEVHHRVKNNLQIIASLLNSQAITLTDEAAQLAIRESQHRVHAMALIHQRIYQPARLAQVSMPTYLPELVEHLREAYATVAVQVEVAIEPIVLPIAQAVPIGLFVNEAFTNALKHAFPAGQAGGVRVALRQVAAATYQLVIEDNGVGLPPSYAPGRNRSLGMKLLHGFSRQLGGELRLSEPPGLTISLLFSEAPAGLAPDAA